MLFMQNGFPILTNKEIWKFRAPLDRFNSHSSSAENLPLICDAFPTTTNIPKSYENSEITNLLEWT